MPIWRSQPGAQLGSPMEAVIRDPIPHVCAAKLVAFAIASLPPSPRRGARQRRPSRWGTQQREGSACPPSTAGACSGPDEETGSLDGYGI